MLGHLLAITEGRQMVALLTRLEWASGARRRNVLHRHSRYLGQVTLTRRPRWIAGSSGSPRHNFAWQVWSESPTGRDPSIWFRP